MPIAPGFDAGATLEAIRHDDVTVPSLVPTMVLRVLEELAEHRGSVHSLALIVCGGTVVPADLAMRMERELGCDCVIVFGQAEMSCVMP